MRVKRVVSGGQTGADRAALDAAITLGLPYGGWCPAGGWAEDLPSPPGLLARYPALREAPAGPHSTRTRWNVRDSDATLVLALTCGARSPGTGLTVDVATALGRPVLVAGAADVAAVRAWLEPLGACVLNVAGPRESEEPGLYAAAYRMLCSALVSGPE
jgi:hypothetical protein